MLNNVKNNYYLIRTYLNEDSGYLAFLFLILGALIGAFSLGNSTNLYLNIKYIFQNEMFLFLFFLAVLTNTYIITSKITENIMIVIRRKNSYDLTKTILSSLFLANVIVYLMTLVIVLAVSIIFCGSNFSIIYPQLIWSDFVFDLVIILIKLFFFANVISYIFGLIFIIWRKQVYIICMFLFFLLFIIYPVITELYIVDSFSDIPWFFSFCLLEDKFLSLPLNIFFSTLHFIIFVIIYMYLLHLAMSGRRDILCDFK